MGDDSGISTRIGRTDEEEATMSDTMTIVGQRLSMPTLPTLDGTAMDMAELRGKKVLLFMWGSW